jgi:CBS domain-containing protein
MVGIILKVKDVMTRKPKTLKQQSTLAEALRFFTKYNITGCPVISNDNVVGIITQSDILKIINVHSKIQKNNDLYTLVLSAIKNEKFDTMKGSIKKILKSPVKSYMTKTLITVSEDDDVYVATRLISEHDVQRLPVVRGKKLVGIVSRKDLINLIDQ